MRERRSSRALHRELVGLAEPALDRASAADLEVRGDVQVAGAPGPALRYWYVQPTAYRAPRRGGRRARARGVAESQITVAPAIERRGACPRARP